MNRLDEVQIRAASDADFRAIQSIYADEILYGTSLFADVPPSVIEMMAHWRGLIANDRPYLIASQAGPVCGFAYLSPYRFDPSASHTAEISVCVAQGSRRQGIGTQLLAALLGNARSLHTVMAVIPDSTNRPVINMHQSLGFIETGRLSKVGQKDGHWIDSLILQKQL